jgi:AcrR family transcriptional regulator
MSSEISQTRKKIIEAASTLLLNTKGKGVRMADIAKASGVSRQAVYLHFQSRTELMVATVRYLDDLHGLSERVRPFNEAVPGREKLDTFVKFWGNYIPEIYGVAKALMATQDTDEAAMAAWNDRMNSVRSGCRETVEALERDGELASKWPVEVTVDMMWTILSVENWERLTIDCGWTIEEYVERMRRLLLNTFAVP